MMCRLIGTASHLVPLKQRRFIHGEYSVPDFLALFRPGCYPKGLRDTDCEGVRCLVEVKSTHQDSYKIKGKQLKYLRTFARQFELPLIFAVRFLRFDNHALWIVVEDDNSQKTKTISISNLTDGIRQVIWDDYLFMLMPDVQFRVTYDRTGLDQGILHKDYGWQRNFQLECNRFENPISYGRPEDVLFIAFFECFALEPVHTYTDGDSTTQLLKPSHQLMSLADVLYSMNRLPVDKDGQAVFDSSRILAGIQSEESIISRNLVEKLKSEIQEGVVGIVTMGEPDDHFKKWQRLCKYTAPLPQNDCR